jgi:hypothetical protein
MATCKFTNLKLGHVYSLKASNSLYLCGNLLPHISGSMTYHGHIQYGANLCDWFSLRNPIVCPSCKTKITDYYNICGQGLSLASLLTKAKVSR